jgi:hypothetical protein
LVDESADLAREDEEARSLIGRRNVIPTWLTFLNEDGRSAVEYLSNEDVFPVLG